MAGVTIGGLTKGLLECAYSLARVGADDAVRRAGTGGILRSFFDEILQNVRWLE